MRLGKTAMGCGLVIALCAGACTHEVERAGTDESPSTAASGVDAGCATPPPVCTPVGPPQVFAWGDNEFGEVGPIAVPAAGAKVVVPTPVPGLPAGIVALAAGDTHSLALDDQGHVWAWGANGCGELGVAPYDIATDTSCFWDESPPRGQSTCVGGTCSGPAGGGACNTDADCPGASPFQSTPAMVQGLPRPAIAIAAGMMFSVALLDDGTVTTWGYNLAGTLGTGHNNYVANPAPQLVMMNGAPLSGVRSIHAGDYHVIAVTDHGVVGWGDNYHGELDADSQGYDLSDPYPVPPISIPDATSSVTTGGLHSYYVDGGGSLWGFGSYWNAGGSNLGDLTSSRSPLPILGPSQLGTSKIREVGSGGYFGVALGDDGQVWFWGDVEANTSGQVPGPGPTTIPGLPSDVTDVWAGNLTAYARDTAGQIWSFGWDEIGELGVATPPANGGPVQIPTITGVTLFSTSASDHALALGYACAPTTSASP